MPVHLIADVLIPSREMKARLKALARFNCLLLGIDPPPPDSLPTTLSDRLCTVLRCLDGRGAGASYRDIAVNLFGHDRVRSDWNAPGDYLKTRVRRACERGRVLTEGRYRDFLR